MRDAFAVAYPSEWSILKRVFYPLVRPRTYLDACYLLLMFPLGIGYFVFLVVTLAVGGSLIWTFVGPVVLLVGLYLSRWLGDAEAWMARLVGGIPLRRPPTAIERGQSFREQVKTRLIDPTTWTGLAYLGIQFPVGIAAFVVIVTLGSVTGAFLGVPIWLAVSPQSADDPGLIEFGPTIAFWSGELNDPIDALPLIPLGLLAALLLVHAITAYTAVHISWARLMLGSRANPAPLRLPSEPPPVPEPPAEAQPPLHRDEPPPTPSPLVAPSIDAPAAEPPPAASPFPAPLAPSEANLLVPELDAPVLVATHEPLDTLTTREREVLALIARGYSNAAIAETFVISEGTVKTHVKRVLAKLGLRDRTQAAIYAYETGFAAARQPAIDQPALPEPTPIVSRATRR
jgi:DNA-binding CsgD family transcriptional regulator